MAKKHGGGKGGRSSEPVILPKKKKKIEGKSGRKPTTKGESRWDRTGTSWWNRGGRLPHWCSLGPSKGEES